MTRRLPGRLGQAALIAMVIALGGCATDEDGALSLPELPKLGSLNPFVKGKEPLPGERVAVLAPDETFSTDLAAADGQVVLPEPVQNESWTQPGGVPSNAPGHLALGGGLKSLWSADAGQGSSSAGKLIASPIVAGGKIFTLDANGTVSAFATSGGGRAWSTPLKPENEDGDAGYGGGLATDGERIYAGTGFGTAVALDARTGAKVWEKPLGSPIRNSPTVADGRMVVVTTEGRVACLSTIDGSELWSFRGQAETSSLLTNASPAIEGSVVVVPYASGDVVALKADSGETLWQENLSGSHSGSSLAALSDPSRPVIDGGTVFAVGHAGRMIATSEKTGERVWSMNVAGVQTPWVAGDAVFVVDTSGRLMSLARTTGKVRWAQKLPGESAIWNGPVLAGGRLWLVSSKGLLVGVDAATGTVASQRDIGQRVFIAPVVAEGRMYVLTDKANLIAFD